ncbi:hypothetical protein FisN_9Lh279 [Fistulifera solaris]|uniref:Uncharacterized protein n=1 Tax=Fistulifera solaris TaxID=1519565 RepID=A0A1Z5KKY9_FISSO|nr:hypothetical protein FisN_9Lh279 [Fistulifera solaris]|eukprot:GAX26973.1 hypothetical protein FisN_9Lh279 [Fistulifera solaris]
MKKPALIYLITSLCIENAAAFVVLTPSTSSSMQLNLRPAQGPQLIAAYNAAYCDKKDTDEDDVPTIATPSEDTRPQGIAAARRYVGRLFSAPSSLLHPQAEGVQDGWTSFVNPIEELHSKSGEEDVVLYPVVGFCLTTVQNGVRALPTVSHPACRLHDQHNEVIYGWYSPACRLEP